MNYKNFESLKQWLQICTHCKIALVRCDLNIPSNIEDLSRIYAVRDTIQSLRKLGLKVVLISHYKRPKPEDFFTESFSLGKVAEKVAVVVGEPVDFISTPVADLNKEDVKSPLSLLENLRFYPGETKNDDDFAQNLAKLADVYINDAFSVSHRAHASVAAITKFLPSFSGLAFDREIEGISKVTSQIARPYVAIIGGSKVSSKINVLKQISKQADTLVVGGAMANTFLAAKEISVGKSLVEPEFFELALDILRNSSANVVLPSDFMISESIETPGIHADRIQNNMSCFDIGAKTVQNIKNIIEGAKTLLWNGALGAFEFANFDFSSKELSKFIANQTQSKSLISVIGGGETVASIGDQKDKMSFVSTAGGAFLEYVSGDPLPGLEALKEKE